MATHVRLRGTYYEVGLQLGQLKKADVQAQVQFLKQSEFYAKASEYMKTEDGATAYKNLLDATSQCRLEYVSELKGVADGAEVTYEDLFLLNIGPELTAAMADVPGETHGVSYGSIFDGCINITLELVDGQVYMAHTEDVDSFYKDLGFMMSVEILDKDGHVVEKWTEYTIAGVVPGSGFGFNSHGIMFAHNNIYPKGFNSHGIPRRFMCRKLMTAKNAEEAKTIMTQSPGIASASTMIFLKKSPGPRVTVLETVYGASNGQAAEFHPQGVYHHCNIFQHLSHDCHPEESSVHRAAVVSQFLNRGEIRTKADLVRVVSDLQDREFRDGNVHLSHDCHPEESSVHRAAVVSQFLNRVEIRQKSDLARVVSDLQDRFQHLSHDCHPEESSVHRAAVVSQFLNRGQIRTKADLVRVVSDQQDGAFPVFRTGRRPDYLETVATGLFDLKEGSLAVYTDKPSASQPALVLQVG